ncbi:Rpn family recombination-promoting nuclease/putative transposase [Butyrivibrio sp. FCS014]|uniref:Rpn family recombination-promoting nuclease/putative transposase n=1 Tax=Butyrivibrio sp. FCS014 TaxID=1408304 RepID=UPI000465781A|nr:Rpn family recombination-promoting nuclease/putative transposase [Butyrivibrio sp. FCS014]
MQEETTEQIKERRQISNHNVADSGGKLIFENPTLCSQLLREYSGIEILKDVKPEDIEDVTERFIPMFTDEREADVVKKVHLTGVGDEDDDDVFIALIEHKSGVEYNVVMQILRYMVYIWEDYEKQMETLHPGISHTKGFKYPPILPIVYYEDRSEWNASETLHPRIALERVFSEYIPDFKYHLISINNFGKEELIGRNDSLSLVMLLNRIRNAEEFRALNLPKDYIDRLITESPKDVLSVIARVIAVVLRKQNIPEDAINDLVDQLKERKGMALFDNYVGFDVQEEWRKAEQKYLVNQVCKKLKRGLTPDAIAIETEESLDYIQEICKIACRSEMDCDVDKVFDELQKKRKSMPV